MSTRATREELVEALRGASTAPGMGWLTQAAAMLVAPGDASEPSQQGARLTAMRQAAEQTEQLAGVGDIESSAQAIALSVVTMVRLNVEDEMKSWERDRDREKAFGAELDRLATGEGTKLPPEDRTACLSLLAQSISEGWDGPPKLEDYVDAMERAAARRRGPMKARAS